MRNPLAALLSHADKHETKISGANPGRIRARSFDVNAQASIVVAAVGLTICAFQFYFGTIVAGTLFLALAIWFGVTGGFVSKLLPIESRVHLHVVGLCLVGVAVRCLIPVQQLPASQL